MIRGKREEHRVNRRIRIPEIRLIGPDGEQLGCFATSEALKRAEELGYDLVEIAPTAKPPVCKIMDYGKFKYEQSKKEHEARKHQVVIKTKEIKLRPATDEHDFQTKLRHVKEFLEEGDKVKITLQFRGREMAHKDIGEAVLKRVVAEVQSLAELAQAPMLEGRQMHLLLAPIKKK
ncbi:MAG: translation initiation factor IF-3 [Deltaproteobacteria bacterium]|nr:translation initiation factor IF-3 [Deltaproteobacteria bacterium]